MTFANRWANCILFFFNHKNQTMSFIAITNWSIAEGLFTVAEMTETSSAETKSV